MPARVLLAASIGLLSACMSPEEYRRDADREVYALIDARRAQLFDADAGFTVEPPPGSLRQRILGGEWSPDTPLTLTDFLEIAAENSRDYQTRKERLYQTALDLTFERWLFMKRPFASLGASVDGTFEDADQARIDGEAGFTRLLGSGASIVADIGSDLFRFVSTGDGWDVISDIGLSITQPLMRGTGERIVKEPLTQAERDLVYEVRAFERFRRTFAVDVARRVYDLLQSLDELDNEEHNYDELVKLRERNRAMAEAGRLSDSQADQAQQDELRSEARLIVLRTNLERQLDDFNIFLGLPVDADLKLDRGEFERLSDEDPLLGRIEEERAVAFALEVRLDHLTALDRYDDRERQVEIAADALRAGLSLDASVDASSREGRPLDFRDEQVNWSTSLSFDLPLDRVAERNAYRGSLIALEAERRALELDSDTVQADVRDALRVTDNARQDYVIQKEAVVLAERRVESIQLLLDAGRANTQTLLDAQRDLVLTQNAATAALISFTLARLDLYLQLELLRVDEGGIRVEEQLTSRVTEDG